MIFLYSDGFKAGFCVVSWVFVVLGVGLFCLFCLFGFFGWLVGFLGFCDVKNIIVLFFFIACLFQLSECEELD